MVTVELLTTNAYSLRQGFTGEDLAYYLRTYCLSTQGFTGEDRQLETDAARVKEEQQLEPYSLQP